MSPGDDRLNGGLRNDLIYRFRGNDQLYEGPCNDQIHGGPCDDRIYGETGNDRIVDRRGATPCSRDREPSGSPPPIATAAIGWCARPLDQSHRRRPA